MKFNNYEKKKFAFKEILKYMNVFILYSLLKGQH